MAIVINRSGKDLMIPELRKKIPWNGQQYVLPDVVAEKYRMYLEVIDESKDKIIEDKDHTINTLNSRVSSLNAFFDDDVKYTRLDVLYSFQFKDDENFDSAIERLKLSIMSIIDQNVNVCVCNTSKRCIKSDLNEFKKIKYYHQDLGGDEYCKTKTINIGVDKLVKSKYFLLSDIDLIYNPNFVKRISRYTLSKTPKRVVFYNRNLNADVVSHVYDECKNHFNMDGFDVNRTQYGIAPGNGLVHVKSFKDVGGFDERFVGYGPEDAEFNLRISQINDYIEDDDDVLCTYHLFHTINIDKKYYHKNVCLSLRTEESVEDKMIRRVM